ncbi:hypothetical protein QQ008_16585 [Fulvivirgaceae bacterium BMA10]|uniref:Calx-beta domain-containing protein n=1 Tax=Splendidivirga corallicola TaxID=3051826 RepID=A0ABT8KS34_9BACT|nr:hypothetical protein [Fulvivirgaceae bacterium BMA10]
MKNILTWMVIIGSVAMIACDRIERDVVPTNNNDEKAQQLFTTQNSPAILNVVGNTTIVGNLKLEVALAPSKGKVSFIEEGMALYTPNTTFSSGEDSVSFNIFDNGTLSDTKGFTITLSQDSSSLPCQNASIFYHTTTNKNDSVFILSLDPNRYCDEFEELNTIRAPQHGSVSQTGDDLYYMPDQDYCGSDSVIYRLKFKESIINALISIDVQEKQDSTDCITSLIDDHIILQKIPGESIVSAEIFPLQNDHICDGAHGTLAIKDPPAIGTAVVHGDSISYEATAVAPFSENFTYSITDKEGTMHSATITVTYDPILGTCSLKALDDSFTFKTDTIPTDSLNNTQFSLDLNVIQNDSISGECDYQINILEEPQTGNAQVTDRNSILLTGDKNFVGEINLKYILEDKTAAVSDTANVTVSINEN